MLPVKIIRRHAWMRPFRPRIVKLGPGLYPCAVTLSPTEWVLIQEPPPIKFCGLPVEILPLPSPSLLWFMGFREIASKRG